LLELTGHRPLFCHHHAKPYHSERLWKENKAASAVSEPHTPAPFRKTPAIDLVAMETQPKTSKPAPAEQSQTLADEGRSQQPPEITLASTPAVVQPIQPIQPQPLADEVADEGHAQQTPEVAPASTPAVVQPIHSIQPQPLADEVADEGHAQQPQEVTPASTPAVVQPIQPLADAGGTETVAETPLPIGRWGVERCARWFSDDQKCLVAAKGAVEHGIDGKILANLTRSDLIELGVSEERAQDVHQASQELARAPPQESAQPLAGEEHVAGVDYNDKSHDVKVGSDMGRSDGGRDMHGSEVADIAFMREVRVVRRKTPRQLKVGRIRHTSIFKPFGGIRA